MQDGVLRYDRLPTTRRPMILFAKQLCFAKLLRMVRFASDEKSGDTEVEVRETHPSRGVSRYFSESTGGVWFTGLPRAGRWREILGRFTVVRSHADDPMRVVEFAEEAGRVRALRVEIVDRRADTLIVLRHAGAPFRVRAID